METSMTGSRRVPWRLLGWSTLAALLAAPAVAMRFTTEVNWDETDFIVMGILLGSVGLGAEFLLRVSSNTAYRLGALLALVVSFLIVWANLAVGMIGSEDNPYNLLFIGVIGLAAVGAGAARLQPAGMALATLLAGVAQLAVSIVGLSTDLRGGLLSAAFALPWLAAAALFRMAARN